MRGRESKPRNVSRSESLGGRRDDQSRERRRGPSRLSAWSGRKLLLLTLGWIVTISVLVTTAALLSVVREHSVDDVAMAATRSNLIGLAATLVLPPACLALQWWRMVGRRRG